MDEPEPVGAADELTFTLLTRRDCPLCDGFRADLARWDGGRRRYTLSVIDIDTDPDLVERFGARVPILMHGNTELCSSHFKEESLNDLIPPV